MICKNPNCKKEFKKTKNKKYCSKKCQEKDIYQRKKEYYIAKARKWEKDNPERYRELSRKANTKFRTEKRERFNELMLKQYYKDKPKWLSRNWTYQILKLKKKTDIDKFCKKCKREDNLILKFEVYPNTSKDIRQAIKDKKIYYLCKECRYGN